MKKKIIVFRVDGNKWRGMGHVYNTLDLADGLRKRINCEIIFMMKGYSEAVKKIKSSYPVIKINKYLNLKAEIEFIIKKLEKLKPDIYITDILEIKREYADRLRKMGIRTVCIDILGKTKFRPDILINRTIIRSRLKRYNLKDKMTKFYLGSKYVIMSEQFKRMHKVKRQISNKINSVLVTLGGSDPMNLVFKVLRVLDKIEKKMKVVVVIGPAYKNKEKLLRFVKKLKRKYILIFDAMDMAELMMKADVAISAGGRTVYELAVTGTPSLVFCVEPEQLVNMNEFEKYNFLVNLGWGSKVSEKKLIEKFNYLENQRIRGIKSRNGKKLVDGKGLERVVKIIKDNI